VEINSSLDLAKLLLEGKSCDSCIHRVWIDLDGQGVSVCRHPKKSSKHDRVRLPDENICSLWWDWND